MTNRCRRSLHRLTEIGVQVGSVKGGELVTGEAMAERGDFFGLPRAVSWESGLHTAAASANRTLTSLCDRDHSTASFCGRPRFRRDPGVHVAAGLEKRLQRWRDEPIWADFLLMEVEG